MHDPLVVAFEIPRPWPERSPLPTPGAKGVRWRIRLHHDHVPGCENDPPHRAGAFPWWKPGSYSSFWRLAARDFYWPPLITVWHREPGGCDALTVCQKRTERPDGTWKYSRGWVWHVHHWKVQVPPLQGLRRRLLTRCAWCGGRSRKTDPVNTRRGWDGPRARWWQGERDLYHGDCSAVSGAHQTCICDAPVLDHDTYGSCARCGRGRSFGMTDKRLQRVRELNEIPTGGRK